MADFASHPAAVLSDGAYAVFAKFSNAANGQEQFEIELQGLRLLANLAGVLIPTPIDVAPAGEGCILVLEGVQEITRGPRQWRDIGRTLARIHQVKGEHCGLETDGYFGPIFQDNRPQPDWPSFYIERRLRPTLEAAATAWTLPPALIRQVEALMVRLPALCGPEPTPALLHGDAQRNNFISTENGPVVIDPAVHYGHPEMDLAALDYWQPVPDEVFEGYQEILPIDPGFWERRALWKIWAYLAAIAVEGLDYVDKLTQALAPYV